MRGSDRPRGSAQVTASGERRPFVGFEHFMYADDRPSHPMTFWLRVTARGQVEAERFGQAVRDTLKRHPLLAARIDGAASEPLQRLAWVAAPELKPLVDIAPAGAPLAHSPLDPTRALPFRVYVRQGVEEAKIWLEMHHAACDGLGAMRFLEDLLALYAGADDKSVSLRPLDAALLADRGRFHLTPGERLQRLPRDLSRAALFFRNVADPLASRGPGSGVGIHKPSVQTRELASVEVRRLKAATRQTGGTVNDLLLRDLFLAVDEWNRTVGERRRIRLAMPISMRRFEDQEMPAANVVSMCFLDRQGKLLDDPAALLASIVSETRSLKAHAMGHALLMVIGCFARRRRGLTWLLTPRLGRRCLASAVLSNLGEPLRSARLPRNDLGELKAHGLVITRVELLPPVRPSTAAALGVVTYAGRMALSLHFDAAALAPEEADSLLDAFVARLRASQAPEQAEGGSLLDRLVTEHAARRKHAEPFRSLPMGKHAQVVPTFPELPMAPQPKALPSAAAVVAAAAVPFVAD